MGIFTLLSGLLVLALALSLAPQPALRMARLWMGQDGIPRLKLDFTVDGVPAKWGYACWTGPFTENLSKFGFPGEGPYNEILRNLPPNLNHNIEGGALSINGSSFPAGIGVHAPSKIAFSLKRKISRFSCLVGLDRLFSTMEQQTGIIYSLLADGQEIFKSPKLKSDADPFPIDISVAGVNELVLFANTTEFYDIDSDVDWVNLKFEP